MQPRAHKFSDRSVLTFGEKVIWLAFNILFGILPAVVFFTWIERNMDFRRPFPAEIERKLGGMFPEFPWISFSTWSLSTKLIWDFCIMMTWGVIHSVFAQHSVQDLMSSSFPVPVLRTIYVMITGLSAWIMMSCWQPTEYIVWNFIGDTQLSNWLNFSFSLIFTSGILYSLLLNYNFFDFFGFNQLLFGVNPNQSTAGTKRLHTTGVYSIVRHPLHFFFLMSILVTPFMTLDRLLFLFTNIVFLTWAIPVEESKLEKEFGASYTRYKHEVPALVPFLK